MDAAQINGHHLWREFWVRLRSILDGLFRFPTHDFIPELASDGCPSISMRLHKGRVFQQAPNQCLRVIRVPWNLEIRAERANPRYQT
jgi:hypothetical protein